MTNLKFILSSLVLLLISNSVIAKTNLASYTHKGVITKTYTSLVLVSASSDLGINQTLERVFSETLSRRGVRIYKYSDYGLVTDKDAGQKLNKLARENNIEAMLVVHLTDSQVHNATTPSNIHAVAYNVNGTTIVNGYQTGGINFSYLSTKNNVYLFDFQKGEKVWTAQTQSVGNGFMGWKSMSKSVRNKVIKDLEAKRFIPR